MGIKEISSSLPAQAFSVTAPPSGTPSPNPSDTAHAVQLSNPRSKLLNLFELAFNVECDHYVCLLFKCFSRVSINIYFYPCKLSLSTCKSAKQKCTIIIYYHYYNVIGHRYEKVHLLHSIRYKKGPFFVVHEMFSWKFNFIKNKHVYSLVQKHFWCLYLISVHYNCLNLYILSHLALKKRMHN